MKHDYHYYNSYYNPLAGAIVLGPEILGDTIGFIAKNSKIVWWIVASTIFWLLVGYLFGYVNICLFNDNDIDNIFGMRWYIDNWVVLVPIQTIITIFCVVIAKIDRDKYMAAKEK